MIRLYKTPPITKWLYPQRVWSLNSSSSIYLTFDDGPNPEVTPWVLDQLNQIGAKATFFCLGKNIERNQSLAKDVLSSGHLLSNHGFNHLNGWRTSDEEYVSDVKKGDQVLRELGVQTEMFRPPYGRIKSSQARMLGKQIIMWSHLSWDFDHSLDVCGSLSSLKKAKTGSILTFHDSSKAFRNLRMLLPELLRHFDKCKIKLTTLDND